MFCNHCKKYQLNTKINWPSNVREYKAMMLSILQYSLEFANLFWNHSTFSTMKKLNFFVNCLDSLWMTASRAWKLHARLCLCTYHAHKSSLKYMKKRVRKLFLSLNYFPVRNLSVLLHENVFLQYKINMCLLNLPCFFKCYTKSDCLYLDITHILS